MAEPRRADYEDNERQIGGGRRRRGQVDVERLLEARGGAVVVPRDTASCHVADAASGREENAFTPVGDSSLFTVNNLAPEIYYPADRPTLVTH